MLFDVLGIALAFASIMLFFSMLVTSIAQAVQATFNLRYRNLRSGLESLGERVEGISTDDYKNGLVEMLSFGKGKSKYWLVNFIRQFTDIKKTEITEEELAKYISKYVTDITDAVTMEAKSTFNEIEQFMSKRFQRFMHNMSILIGVALAIGFQLNTFDLLRDISIDPELRDSLIEMAQKTTADYEKSVPVLSYPDIAKSALDELGKKYPAHIKEIEEVSGEITSANDAIEGIKLVIKDDKVINDYELLLTNKVNDYEKESKDALTKMLSIGAKYNFKVCDAGLNTTCGLFSSMNNFFGTLVSGILISLGAPFWFNAINNIASMRDKTKSRR